MKEIMYLMVYIIMSSQHIFKEEKKMPKLLWDQVGEHFFETGDDHAVVYPYNTTSKAYDSGYAWSGITGVTESPSGADETPLYADNIKYLSLRSAEEYAQTVTAYAYPPEFAELDGSAYLMKGVRIYQQARKTFGFSYRSLEGNDTEGNDHGYRLHLVYGLTTSPSERSYKTVNDSPEAIEFSWEMKGVPVAIDGYKSSCLITIDSDDFETTEEKARLKALEDILYGTDGTTSYSAVTPVGTENPVTEGWYERSGESEPYTYTLSADTTVNAQKTYYAKTTTEGTTARLPLPDEVLRVLNGNNVGG